MKNLNLGQWVFYVAFASGLYLMLNPSPQNKVYLYWVTLVVCAWVVWSGLWNLLVATKIIVANRRLARKIENSANRGLMMGLSLMWITVAGYIIFITVTGKELLFFLR